MDGNGGAEPSRRSPKARGCEAGWIGSFDARLEPGEPGGGLFAKGASGRAVQKMPYAS